MKMNINYIIMGTLIVLLVLSSVQAVQINKIKSTGANAGTTNTGALDTTGWNENEIMNYEMHGTIPSRAASIAVPQTGSGMVGGC